MRATAFCPGHVTCVFQPHRVDEPLRSGSRGIGFCLELGARAEVVDHDRLEVHVNGVAEDAAVTREALGIMGADGLLVRIETDLPVSQGFAMSAAGTVSACLAAASLQGSTSEAAFHAAHVAELTRGGGMGDVAGIMAGGVSVRRSPGPPPYGEVERLDLHGDVLLAVLGPPIRTTDILSDDVMRRRIESMGSECIGSFLKEPGWGSLFTHSRRFCQETGLLDATVEKALDALQPHGEASMCMLGNSLFFRGDLAAARDVLGDDTWTCGIDLAGPGITNEGRTVNEKTNHNVD